MYLISLAAGILVGIVYGLLHVRSPAPPIIALIGLLGILIGEQLVPLTSRLIKGQPVTLSWFAKECMPNITGTADKPADKPVMTARKDEE